MRKQSSFRFEFQNAVAATHQRYFASRNTSSPGSENVQILSFVLFLMEPVL